MDRILIGVLWIDLRITSHAKLDLFVAPNGAPIRKQEYNCVFIKIDIPTAALQTRTWRLIFHFSYSAVSLLKCKTFFLNQKQCPMPNAQCCVSIEQFLRSRHRISSMQSCSYHFMEDSRGLFASWEAYIIVTNTSSQTMSCLKSPFNSTISCHTVLQIWAKIL